VILAIFLTFRKHSHHFTKREMWAHKTNLTPPLWFHWSTCIKSDKWVVVYLCWEYEFCLFLRICYWTLAFSNISVIWWWLCIISELLLVPTGSWQILLHKLLKKIHYVGENKSIIVPTLLSTTIWCELCQGITSQHLVPTIRLKKMVAL
jgi:hypothetical protein